MRAVWLWPLALCACTAAPTSDPAETTTADIEIGTVEAADPEAAPARKGLFAMLRAAPPDAAAPPLSEAAGTAATGAVDADVLEAGDEDPVPAPKHGLFGLFAAPQDSAAPIEADAGAPVRTAAVASGGLFGGARATADKVAPGTVLPFGEVARVCAARKSDLGKEVDERGKWRLYDTIPNSAAPRVMYLTGFDDKCARMFTASLVLFGLPTAHETVRYATRGAYSETDEAYEKIKDRVCGVKRGARCPADRISRLEDLVTFVTAYPGFGTSDGPWLDMLLYKGDLAASSLDH